jgi:hypothetical protein
MIVAYGSYMKKKYNRLATGVWKLKKSFRLFKSGYQLWGFISLILAGLVIFNEYFPFYTMNNLISDISSAYHWIVNIFN